MILNLLDIEENLHVFVWFVPFLVRGLVGVNVPIRYRRPIRGEVSENCWVAGLGFSRVHCRCNIPVTRLKNQSLKVAFIRLILVRCQYCAKAYLQN